MKALVFGSLNLDRTYHVEHIVRPGETIASSRMELFPGGKGLNQAVALARAGMAVCFAGAVGEDGGLLLETLKDNAIDFERVQRLPGPSGHAIIQVDGEGANSILILSGANGGVTPEYARRVLDDFGAGDVMLCQNEISSMPDILKTAHARKIHTVYNPSPMNRAALACDLNDVDCLVINESEAQALVGACEPDQVLETCRRLNPRMEVLLTLGDKGSCFMDESGEVTRMGISPVEAVDTTAAGDCFEGFFVAARARGKAPRDTLRLAAAAAALCVTKKGASPSIPFLAEAEAFMQSVRLCGE